MKVMVFVMKCIVFIFLLASTVAAQDSLKPCYNYKPYTFKEYQLPIHRNSLGDTLGVGLMWKGYTLKPQCKSSWDKTTQTLGIQNVPQWVTWVIFGLAVAGGLSITLTIVR